MPDEFRPTTGYSDDEDPDAPPTFDLRALVTSAGIFEIPPGGSRHIVIGAMTSTGKTVGVLLDPDDLDAIAALTRHLRTTLSDA
jgi:hypothetical protein